MSEPTAAVPVGPAIRMEDVGVAARRPGRPSGRGERLAAWDVNWTVGQGDYWVVAGLQSSGKSDFLLMTAGLTPPASGEYRLFGERMPIYEEAQLAHRLRVGLVFESGHLFNRLNLWENVALPLRYHRNLGLEEAVRVVEPLLEALGLTALADRPPSAVGVQWQKRAMLARALALEPMVLLLDDPLGGLDPRQAQWWLNFLGELSRGHALTRGQPVTLVVTAADLRPWLQCARQFAVLRDGRFEVIGGRAELEAVSNVLVRQLMAEEPGDT